MVKITKTHRIGNSLMIVMPPEFAKKHGFDKKSHGIWTDCKDHLKLTKFHETKK